MSERVYRLERGLEDLYCVEFGVHQAVRSLRFQLNDGLEF